MQNIIFFKIIGLSLFSWFGILGLACIVAAGLFGYLISKGKSRMNRHVTVARAGIIFAVLHGLAGIYLMLK